MSDLKPELMSIKPFSDVYISEGHGKLKNVLKKGFDALGGITKIVRPGQSVLLKPNLTAGEHPFTGGTTESGFVEAVIELIKENCEPGPVYVGENTFSGSYTAEMFKRLGYSDMCERQGATLVDFTDAKRVDAPVHDAMYADIISIPEIVLDADVFITLPVLKNHDTVCVTAAIKNSYGLITDEARRQGHRDDAIEPFIVDILRVRKPDFSIVDGRIGMEGIAGGSYFTHPRFADRIVMGADPVAVDVVCAHIMMQNPRVRYLQWADLRGFGNCNLDYINIHGMPLEQAKVPFLTPAGQLEEQTDGKLRLHDLGSCSRCRTIIQGTLHRFHSPESLLKNVEIVYGPGRWDIPEDKYVNCILAGDCIKEEYRKLGSWIPGCPIDRDDYFTALGDLDIVCSKCENIVSRFIDSKTPEELAFIRILASNKTVFQGKDNEAGATDFLLAVGDCQTRYVYSHIRRSGSDLIQAGLGDVVKPEFFVIHIPGHDLTEQAVRTAFIELRERAEQWKLMRRDI